MKIVTIFFCITIFAFSLFAQTPEQILATANGQSFAVKDLPQQVAADYLSLSNKIAETRKLLLEQQVLETLFELEAKSKNLSYEQFVKQIKSNIPDPPENEIIKVYEANRESLGNRTLAETRQRIVDFLRWEPEQKAFLETFNALKTKYKAAFLQDPNATGLKPADILATVGTKKIALQDFEEKHKAALYETKAKVFDAVKFALNELLYNALVAAEARAQNIATSDLIAREVTDKLRAYTPAERYEIETNFRRQLFAKYKTQILLKEPVPLVFDISTAGAPSKGAATAPVTIVMFSDFQCAACAAVHPVLQRVIAEYPSGKVRFVVRHYPLTQIHADAFPAARAAHAAHAQGKFFEYTEILYRNQQALDAESLKKYAAETGLNLRQFELDFKSEKTAESVHRDLADGQKLGITGTPAVFVNGVKVRLLAADGFREAIDKALKK